MFVGPAAYDKPAHRAAAAARGGGRPGALRSRRSRSTSAAGPTSIPRRPISSARSRTASGEDLSWFWRGWLFTTAQLDQAVDSIVLADSAGVESRIHLRNAGGIPMPVDLALPMDDGSTQRLTLPVEIWFGGDRYTAVVPGPKKVNAVDLDPEPRYPDVRRENNRWPAGVPQSETLRLLHRDLPQAAEHVAGVERAVGQHHPPGEGVAVAAGLDPREQPVAEIAAQRRRTRRAPPRRRCSRPRRGSGCPRPSRSCGRRRRPAGRTRPRSGWRDRRRPPRGCHRWRSRPPRRDPPDRRRGSGPPR